MTDFNLTNDESEYAEPSKMVRRANQQLKAKIDFLLRLRGAMAILTIDRAVLEAIDAESCTDEDVEVVDDIFEQREREAHLRGEPWPWRDSL